MADPTDPIREPDEQRSGPITNFIVDTVLFGALEILSLVIVGAFRIVLGICSAILGLFVSILTS